MSGIQCTPSTKVESTTVAPSGIVHFRNGTAKIRRGRDGQHDQRDVVARERVVQAAHGADRLDQPVAPLVGEQHRLALEEGPALGNRKEDEERKADGVVDGHGQAEGAIRLRMIAARQVPGDEPAEQRQAEEVGEGVAVGGDGVRGVVRREAQVSLEPAERFGDRIARLDAKARRREPAVEPGLDQVEQEHGREQQGRAQRGVFCTFGGRGSDGGGAGPVGWGRRWGRPADTTPSCGGTGDEGAASIPSTSCWNTSAWASPFHSIRSAACSCLNPSGIADVVDPGADELAALLARVASSNTHSLSTDL